MGCEACGEQSAGTLAALANGADGLRRHAEIEPAFVVGKGDVHDTVAPGIAESSVSPQFRAVSNSIIKKSRTAQGPLAISWNSATS